MSEIKVSILCTVYNHEKYLRETLEGFVSQKTNFLFEALVHDDASTDRSASIIREYEQKYPDIVKPIYQTENQHSKGRKITLDILVPKAKGQYIAICEGDDCWIDPTKLQRQYDLLEERRDVDICAHNAEVRYDSHYCGQTHITNSEMEVIPFEDIVNASRGFIPTMSIMVRKEVYERPESNFLRVKGFDLSLFVAGSLRGGMLALSDVMSIYHVYTSGSWNVRNRQSGSQLHYNGIKQYIRALETLNDDTGHKFDAVLVKRIKELKYSVLLYEKKYSEIIKDEMFKSFGKKNKIRIWLCFFHLNWLITILSRLKKTTFRLCEIGKRKSCRSEDASFTAPFLPYEIPSYVFGNGSYPPRNACGS